MENLIRGIREFNRERDWEQFHSPNNPAMALSAEAAEILEHFLWVTDEESRNLSAAKLLQVKEEIGDVLIFLANLADKLGIDLMEVAREKLERNRLKYPADKVRGKSLKYSEY